MASRTDEMPDISTCSAGISWEVNFSYNESSAACCSLPTHLSWR